MTLEQCKNEEILTYSIDTHKYAILMSELSKVESTTYRMYEVIMDQIYPTNVTEFHQIRYFQSVLRHLQIDKVGFDEGDVTMFTYRWLVALFSDVFHYKVVIPIWDYFVLYDFMNHATSFISRLAEVVIKKHKNKKEEIMDTCNEVTGSFTHKDLNKLLRETNSFIRKMKKQSM